MLHLGLSAQVECLAGERDAEILELVVHPLRGR